MEAHPPNPAAFARSDGALHDAPVTLTRFLGENANWHRLSLENVTKTKKVNNTTKCSLKGGWSGNF